MAFQAVEQVKKAEAEAAEIVLKAEQNAKAKIAAAHADGQALKTRMETEANAQVKSVIRYAEAEAEKIRDKAEAPTAEAIVSLENETKTKQQAVILKVAEQLF